MTKTSNRHMRTVLFMLALVAVQRDAQIQAFYEHLMARQEPKPALVAAMRKLLHAIWGMLTPAQSFDLTKFDRPPSKPSFPFDHQENT